MTNLVLYLLQVHVWVCVYVLVGFGKFWILICLKGERAARRIAAEPNFFLRKRRVPVGTIKKGWWGIMSSFVFATWKRLWIHMQWALCVCMVGLRLSWKIAASWIRSLLGMHITQPTYYVLYKHLSGGVRLKSVWRVVHLQNVPPRKPSLSTVLTLYLSLYLSPYYLQCVDCVIDNH